MPDNKLFMIMVIEAILCENVGWYVNLRMERAGPKPKSGKDRNRINREKEEIDKLLKKGF